MQQTSTRLSEMHAGPAITRGSLREVAALALPVILTQLSRTAMGVTDSVMVGRLGPVELAGVGFAGIWAWTLFCAFFGTATGVQTFVSQADGAGKQRECGQWVWQASYVLVPVSCAMAVLLFAGMAELLRALGPSAELQTAAVSYLRPRILGAPGFVVGVVIGSFFRGFGDTRTPLYATLVANGVNVVLDYGLIFGKLGMPDWGVAGD